jgi:hypothetical protein
MSDGAILHGQQFDPRGVGIKRRFTEQVLDYDGPDTARVSGAEGATATELDPIDRAAVRQRIWDVAAITAEYLAANISFPGKTVVSSLPNVLQNYTVTYNKSSGAGADNHPSSQQAFVITDGGSASLSPRAKAQGSAAIIADVTWEIKTLLGVQVDCTHYYFYLATPATLAQVLTKLTTLAAATVTNLPVFKPQTHQVKVYGGQVSLQASADTTVSAGWSENSAGTITSTSKAYAYGDGYSKEVGLTTRILTIPPTIHGALNVIGSNTDTETVIVTVVANTMAIGPTVPVGAITNAPIPITATVTAGVTPTGFSATSPASIPASGLYLVDHDATPAEFGLVLVHAVVVDFAQYV